MRTVDRLLPAFLAFVLSPIAPARAAWPPEGLPLAPYVIGHPVYEMRLEIDETGNIREIHGHIGNPAFTKGARVTLDGTILTQLDPSTGGGVLENFCTDGAGGFFHTMTWSDPPGGPSRARVERITSANVYYGAWRATNTIGSPSETNSACAPDDSGGTYVSWLATNSLSILVSRMNADGTVAGGWPANGKAVATFVWPPGGPRVVRDGTGGALILWYAPTTETNPSWLSVHRLSRNGAFAPGWPAGGLQLTTSATVSGIDQTMVRVIPSVAGDFIAGWWSAGDGIRLQRFGLAGAVDPAWPADGVVVATAGTSVALVSLVEDGSGGAYVLWQQDGLPRVQHVTSGGELASGFVGGGVSPLDAAAVYVGDGLVGATGPAGGLIVSWNDSRTSQPGIRARWLLADGTPDPAEADSARVVARSGTVYDPPLPYWSRVKAAIPDGAGGAYVAWDRYMELPGVNTAYMTRLYHSSLLDAPAPAPGATAGLRLAPNPARGSVVVFAGGVSRGEARLELLDSSGRRLRDERLGTTGSLQYRFEGLDALAPGLYWIRLTDRAGVRTSRFAVVR